MNVPRHGRRILGIVRAAALAGALGFTGPVAADAGTPAAGHAWGAGLGAAAGHSDTNANSPRGLQLYSHFDLWKNLSARHALGLDYGTLGGRDVERITTFYSQSGPLLVPYQDARRIRDRIDRLALQFRFRFPGDPGHGAGAPFTLLGVGYYYDRVRLDDVVSAPPALLLPVQRFSARRTSRWFGVLAGGGVAWKTGPLATGAVGRAEWAFSPRRLWISGGLTVAWH